MIGLWIILALIAIKIAFNEVTIGSVTIILVITTYSFVNYTSSNSYSTTITVVLVGIVFAPFNTIDTRDTSLKTFVNCISSETNFVIRIVISSQISSIHTFDFSSRGIGDGLG